MKILILVDTSGSMGFSPGDEVELRELDKTGELTPILSSRLSRSHDRTILITDFIPSAAKGIEVWKVEEKR